MKKFFRKRWVKNTLLVITAVFVCGFGPCGWMVVVEEVCDYI